MTTQTKWAHLPNAKYIDMILANLKAYPHYWGPVRRMEGWRDAVNTAWCAALDDFRDAAWNEARDAAWDANWNASAAMNAIAALIAYDDCAYMLYCDPDEITILAKLGDHKAILLLSACIAFNRNKSIDNVPA